MDLFEGMAQAFLEAQQDQNLMGQASRLETQGKIAILVQGSPIAEFHPTGERSVFVLLRLIG